MACDGCSYELPNVHTLDWFEKSVIVILLAGCEERRAVRMTPELDEAL